MKKCKETINKLIEKIKTNKFILLVFVVIWFATLVFTLNYYKSSLGMDSFGNDNDIVETTDLNENTIIKQTAVLDYNVNSISIKFATYARSNKGNINIEVVGLRSKQIYLNKDVDVSDVLDNSFLTIGLDEKIDISKDSEIEITLTSDSKEGENVGVYYSPELAFENGGFSINDEIQDGDLKVRFLTDNATLMSFNNSVLLWSIIGLSIVVLIIAICEKKEIVFACITLALGLIFLIIITPMSPPDEQRHYEYCFQLSNYVMGEKDHILIDTEYQDYGDFAGHLNVNSAYETFSEKFNEELHLKNRYEAMIGDVDEATYKLCYFPQTIAITICRLCGANMLKTFYAGRLFNLLFYVVCVYIGIKKTSMHKTLFGIIATLPIFIQQAASYSYDSFLNGLLLIVAAYLFNWLSKEELISNKEVAFLFVVVLLVSPLKVIYSLFIFSFWLIPYKQFGTKKRKNIVLILLCLPVLVQMFLMLYTPLSKIVENLFEKILLGARLIPIETSIMVDNNVSNLVGTGSNILKETRYNMGYITDNIGEVLGLFAHTVRSCIKIWFYEALGRALSGVSIVLPLKMLHIFSYIVLAAALLKEKFVTPISIRISFVFVCIIVGLFVMAGMLVTWTTVGDDIVHGIQGRYFSPLLFFFLSIINNPKIYLPQKLDKYLTFASLIMVFEAVIYVMSYTFVN